MNNLPEVTKLSGSSKQQPAGWVLPTYVLFRPCDACSNFEPENLSKTGTGVLLASSHCAAAVPHLLLLQVTGSTWPLQALEFVTLPLYYFLGPREVTEPSFLFSSVKPSFFLWGRAGSLWLSQAFCNFGSRGASALRCLGFSLRWLLLSRSMGSRSEGSGVVVPRLRCPTAWGIFLEQGSKHVPYFGRQILNH